MIRKKFIPFGLMLFVGCFVLSSAVFVPSSFALEVFTAEVDKRITKEKRATRSLFKKKGDDFLALTKRKQVYIDVKVVLDNKKRYQVMTRTEGDTRRYNVGCRFGSWGQLPMGYGIEYFIKIGDGKNSREVNIVLYPGSRTDHPDNDISCVYDKRYGKSAVLRVRGLYKVTTNEYPNRTDVQLRPILRRNLTAADRRALP